MAEAIVEVTRPPLPLTRYGHRVMTAAIALHDHNFADHYTAAA